MEKVNQNSNSIIEVANDNKANKPEHVIKAEISVDIIGEDEPTKYTKRRERWAVVAVWSLLALAVSSLYFIFVEMNVYSFFALVISVAICAFLFVKASDIDPEENWAGALVVWCCLAFIHLFRHFRKVPFFFSALTPKTI